MIVIKFWLVIIILFLTVFTYKFLDNVINIARNKIK